VKILKEFQGNIGVCLSGGGSRAIAFHLGCLKALQSKGLLGKVRTLSTVSGGSVIGAMYAYHEDTFDSFESKVRHLLKDGLVWKSLISFIFWPRIIPVLVNYSASAIVNSTSFLLRKIFFLDSIDFFNFSLPRVFNRTWVLESTLEKHYFTGKKLNSKTKNDVRIVINSSELQTLSACRFGNNEVSCWKFGKSDPGNINISSAVTASAAYPVLLPSLIKNIEFKDKEGVGQKTKVILSDGGIYENLGITPLFPKRDHKIGYDSDKVDYIFAFDAENSIEMGGSPNFIISRLATCFYSVMRRVQSSNYKLLHEYKASGDIKGFILCKLSQNDRLVTSKCSGYVPFADVRNYPTNFSAMKEKYIDLLVGRGEKLTLSLLEQYFSSEPREAE